MSPMTSVKSVEKEEPVALKSVNQEIDYETHTMTYKCGKCDHGLYCASISPEVIDTCKYYSGMIPMSQAATLSVQCGREKEI